MVTQSKMPFTTLQEDQALQWNTDPNILQVAAIFHIFYNFDQTRAVELHYFDGYVWQYVLQRHTPTILDFHHNSVILQFALAIVPTSSVSA